jgi:hypothetical protein
LNPGRGRKHEEYKQYRVRFRVQGRKHEEYKQYRVRFRVQGSGFRVGSMRSTSSI